MEISEIVMEYHVQLFMKMNRMVSGTELERRRRRK
jgi:hypothetical protein